MSEQAGELVQKALTALVTIVASGTAGWFAATARMGERVRDLERAIKDLSERVGKAAPLAEVKSVEEKLKGLEQMANQLEKSIDDVGSSSHDFAKEADLARFIQEMNNRWTEIARIIGRIEGSLDSPLQPLRKGMKTDPRTT